MTKQMTKQSRIGKFGDGKVVKSRGYSSRRINSGRQSTITMGGGGGGKCKRPPIGGILSELDSNFLASAGISNITKGKSIPTPEEKEEMQVQVQVASSLPQSHSRKPASRTESGISIISCSQTSLSAVQDEDTAPNTVTTSPPLQTITTPRRTRAKLEVPSSSPQYTPFNRTSHFKYRFESTPTPTKQQQQQRQETNDIVKSSQWWEQEDDDDEPQEQHAQEEEEEEEEEDSLLPDVDELLWGGPPSLYRQQQQHHHQRGNDTMQEDLDSMLQSLPQPPESSCSLIDSL